MAEVPDSEKLYTCQIVMLAMGFLGPEKAVLEELGVEQDGRSNVKTDQGKYGTSVEGVYAAGDCRCNVALDCTLHLTTLHCTVQLHYTTLHYTTLNYTTLHYTTLHYTTLHQSYVSRRGQSLVVWGITEGRQAAREVSSGQYCAVQYSAV